MELIIYAAIKFVAYSAWSFLGIRLLSPKQERLVPRSLGLGLLRLVMGIVFGVLIFFAALSLNNATRNSFVTYLIVYVPVRFVEWLIISFIINRNISARRSTAWILGGIVISCLADIPLSILTGERVVPVGRPFC